MTADSIRIRPATPKDLDTIVEFNLSLASETEGKALDRHVLRAGVEAALADANRARYFLAEVDGEVVGQTMFTTEWSDWRNGHFWWIQSVYIDAAHRGRGVFRALYAHIRELAKHEPNVCGIRLYVDNDNHRAIKTYRRLGMELTDYLICEEAWLTSAQS